jgi:hypothetical protein
MALLLKAAGGVEDICPANGRTFLLSELQAFVGGYIETVRTVGGLWLVINEDGKRLALPPNERATGIVLVSGGVLKDVVVGDVVLANSVEMEEDEDDEEAALLRDEL